MPESVTYTSTWEFNGEERPLEIKRVSSETFELIADYYTAAFQGGDGDELAPLPWEDDYETDEITELVLHETLVQPDIDPETVSAAKAAALIDAMLAVWAAKLMQPPGRARGRW